MADQSDNRSGKISRRKVLAAMAGTGLAAALGDLADRQHRPRSIPKVPGAMTDQGLRQRRPNILLIVNDQLRHWQDLPSGLGLSAHEMLLEQGIGMMNFHANTTPCSPSRSNMYFGQHTQHTLMTANVDAPPSFPKLADDLPSLGHLLRAQAYYTAYKGKWHLSHVRPDPGLVYGPYPTTENALEPYGFSDYNADGDPHGSTWTGYRYDGQIASNAVQWFCTKGRAMRGKQPWFLAVNFVNPHDVMYVSTGDAQVASRQQRNMLSPLSTPPTGGVYDKYWDLPLPDSYYQDKLIGKPWATSSYIEMCNWLYGHIDPNDEAAWCAYQSYYFNCVRDVDSHALTVLQALKKLGMDKDTIVIYTSDHGEMAGAHKLRQKGPFMYKENMRLPFIVRHPDVVGGKMTNALGSHMDLVPTILGMAGVDARAVAEKYPYLKGVDISAAISTTGATTERDKKGILFNYGVPLYIDPEFSRKGAKTGKIYNQLSALLIGFESGQFLPSLENPALFRGIHDGRYKFARYFKPADHHQPRDWENLRARNQLELYDTQTDPNEITNLAASPEQHKELLLDLNQRLNTLISAEVGDDLGRELPGPAFLYQQKKS
ncbi:sulfatase-like hydrolase/transferase [Undibacterium sp. TC4M20W]|uniref:sulfatase-like hydrolase/transferase n=1 Tax=Undibacterium sp. TC4M20W TaxID=3413052 RepID=UPI003BF03B3E